MWGKYYKAESIENITWSHSFFRSLTDSYFNCQRFFMNFM